MFVAPFFTVLNLAGLNSSQVSSHAGETSDSVLSGLSVGALVPLSSPSTADLPLTGVVTSSATTGVAAAAGLATFVEAGVAALTVAGEVTAFGAAAEVETALGGMWLSRSLMQLELK